MRSGVVTIAGWTKNSFIDFPGTVATVLFLSGCNLRCPYCHNPQIVNQSRNDPIDMDAIMGFLGRRRNMIRGVVLSGGEPTIQPRTVDLLPPMRALGLRIKLDTNGMLPDVVRKIAPDYLALDVKTLPARYPALCAAPYPDVERRLGESLDIVRAMGDSAEVRITVAPGFVDDEVVAGLGSMLRGVKKLFLQPMQRDVPLLDPGFASAPAPSTEDIGRYRDALAGLVGRCEVRGA